MAKPLSYFEKLKDPRWQKKRLEIMSRDGFLCAQCGSGEKTLNVHHVYYIKNKDPWDYPGNLLVTLCELCHTATPFAVRSLTETISHVPSEIVALFGRELAEAGEQPVMLRLFIAIMQSEEKFVELATWFNSLPLEHRLGLGEEVAK